MTAKDLRAGDVVNEKPNASDGGFLMLPRIALACKNIRVEAKRFRSFFKRYRRHWDPRNDYLVPRLDEKRRAYRNLKKTFGSSDRSFGSPIEPVTFVQTPDRGGGVDG
jgi:hypothetical protein